MNTLLWAAAIVVALPIAWLLLSLAITYTVPPERSGRDLIKRKVAAYGADVSQVPDAAWNEIVGQCIAGAKQVAETIKRPELKNWRANLVRFIDDEALIVAGLLAGERGRGGSAASEEILVRHGVILAA